MAFPNPFRTSLPPRIDVSINEMRPPAGIDADTAAAIRRIEQKVNAMAVDVSRLAADEDRLLGLFAELQTELKTARENNTDTIVQASLDNMANKIEAAIGGQAPAPAPAPTPAPAATDTTTATAPTSPAPAPTTQDPPPAA